MIAQALQRKACLSYWYPRLIANDIPTPLSAITKLLPSQAGDLIEILDGRETEAFKLVAHWVGKMCERIGTPAFLRTGQTSGKHGWSTTCFVSDLLKVPNHVYGLVEYSAMAGIMGLPTDVWVVREFLDLKHDMTAFDGMPVALEFRAFAIGGEVKCVHPYWPLDALRDASVENPSITEWGALKRDDSEQVLDLVRATSREFRPEPWSIDVCQDIHGSWHVTDMAPASISYHWPGCKHENTWPRSE